MSYEVVIPDKLFEHKIYLIRERKVMLDSVLNSSVAVLVSQQIIRQFISLRNEMLSNQNIINEIKQIRERILSQDDAIYTLNE